jgi:hypothetical protein
MQLIFNDFARECDQFGAGEQILAYMVVELATLAEHC